MYFLPYDMATFVFYSLSLHDALPICLFGDQDRDFFHVLLAIGQQAAGHVAGAEAARYGHDHENKRFRFHDAPSSNRKGGFRERDRKSTRLNSSHGYISYAVFCLKKKT